MSAQTQRGRIARITKAKSDLEKKRAAALKKAADLEAEAVRATSGITKHTPTSSISQKQRTAADKVKKAGVERDRAAKLEGEIANKVRDLHAAEQALQRELDRQQKKHDDLARKRQRDEDKRAKDQARKQSEADRKRRESDKRHAREMAREAERAFQLTRTVHVAPRVPDKVKVLVLVASPEDQSPLRLDHEVRDIQEKLRATEHREALELHWRPAVRLPDLLQALNEVRPHIVHFSGHGSQDFLVFEDHQGNSKVLTNDVLAEVLRMSSDEVRLVIFNSCSSAAQAELATDSVDFAIGMNVSIGDEAAKVFAAQLYSSLGFGLSVTAAFEQARLAITLAGLSEASTPALYSADGADPDQVVLVRADAKRAA
jgi:hypothetical protein